jgi:hypothetical protein
MGLEPFDQLPETAPTRDFATFQEVSQRILGSCELATRIVALAGWIVALAGFAATADPIPCHSPASD